MNPLLTKWEEILKSTWDDGNTSAFEGDKYEFIDEKIGELAQALKDASPVCKRCNGTGEVVEGEGLSELTWVCPVCGGNGRDTSRVIDLLEGDTK